MELRHILSVYLAVGPGDRVMDELGISGSVGYYKRDIELLPGVGHAAAMGDKADVTCAGRYGRLAHRGRLARDPLSPPRCTISSVALLKSCDRGLLV
jgi:hypothetical protein